MGYTDRLKRQEKRLKKRIKRRSGKGKSTEKLETKLKDVKFKSAVNNLFGEVIPIKAKDIDYENVKKAIPAGYFPQTNIPKSDFEKRGCKSGYKKEGYIKKTGKIAPSILNKCGSKRKH